MPFRNLGSSDDAYFVDGLVEDLVDMLATVQGLRVRGRGYAEAADRDVVDTGRRLGVNVVVDGSIRRAGDRLRVSARLIGVADGFQIWSSRFERPAGEAFALNDDVAQGIAAALAAKRAEGVRSQPTDPVAIDLYFRARHAIGRFWKDVSMTETRQLFAEALARAPNDPTILAGYVHAHLGRNLFSRLDRQETVTYLRRALTAGGRLPEPWIALAAMRFNQDDDPASAIRALRHALSLAPSSSDAHDLAGRILLEADEADEAVFHLERALWLDPNQRWARVDLMRFAAMSGDWPRAQTLLAEGPGADWVGHARVHQARLWSWPGAPKSDIPQPPSDTDTRMRVLREIYGRAREDRQASYVRPLSEILEPIERLMGQAPQTRALRFFHQMAAEIAAITGHRDAVLEMVEAAVGEGLLDLCWLNRLRLLDPLRGDPRFEALRGRVQERAARVSAAWRGTEETLDEALASLR